MKRGITALAVAAAVALAMAGCSSGGSDASSSSGAAGPIKIQAILDETGAGGFAGMPSHDGIALALKEINKAGGVDGRKIEVTYSDSASDAAQATSLVTKAAASDADAIIYGVLSPSGLAIAPVAQRLGIPLVLLQSTVKEAVDAGNFVFRVSESQTAYYAKVLDYWKPKGVKSISVIIHQDNPTAMQIANDYFIPTAKKEGFKVNAPFLARTTDTDFTAQVNQILAQNPDAVYIQFLGTPIVTFIKQLRDAGYKGYIGSSTSAAGGVLKPLGALADGVVYPVSFSSETKLASGVAFVKAYNAAYGEDPSFFAADGYDSIRLIAAAAKEAGASFDRAQLRKGIQAAEDKGLSGSPTEDPLPFKDRVGAATGLLILWKNGQETVANIK